MKKVFMFFLLFSSANNFIRSQSLVSTELQSRNAVLELFGGVQCCVCPLGDKYAQALIDAFPGKVSCISVHSGFFSTPYPGDQNLGIPEGDSLNAFAGVAGYPAGTTNRIIWPGSHNQPPFYPQNPPNELAIQIEGWQNAPFPYQQGTGTYIMQKGGISHVNIGSKTTWNEAMRLLTVTVELYYIIDEYVSNKLNVVLAENSIVAQQNCAAPDYEHNHVLRHMITGLWGDIISNTNAGTFISRTYTYSVPANFNIDNCEITIFVTQDDNKNTLTGITLPAKNGSTVEKKDANTLSFTSGIYPNPATIESMLILNLIKKGNLKIEIIDYTGRIIYSENLGEQYAGWHLYPVGEWIANTARNIYFLRITSGDEVKTEKIIN